MSKSRPARKAAKQTKQAARRTARQQKRAVRQETRVEKKAARQEKRVTSKTARQTARREKKVAREDRRETIKDLRQQGASKQAKQAARKLARSNIEAAGDRRKSAVTQTRKTANTTVTAARREKRAEVKAINTARNDVTGGPFRPFRAVGRVFKSVGDGIVEAADRFGERLKRNRVRVWAFRDRFADGYPEREHHEWSSHRVGVCFSGGGTRSASASLGQMRALHELGLVDRLDMIGAVSGGSWFSVPYTYLPAEISDAQFLGTHVPPGEVTREWLRAGRRPVHGKEGDNIFAHCVARSDMFNAWNVGQLTYNGAISKLQLRNKKDDESWGQALGRAFLRPLGMFGPRQRYLSGRPTDVQRILQRNRHLERDDFNWVAHRRPFLVVSGTVINWNLAAKMESARRPGKKGEKPIYPFEFTPLYTGTNVLYQGPDTAGHAVIGGGFVEPLGFDTPGPREDLDGEVKVHARRGMNRLSLQDVMAVSGAAPAWHLLQASTLGAPLHVVPVVGDLFSGGKKCSNLFPEFLTWHIGEGDRLHARNRHFADGGFADNLGLIPLLKRGVERAVVFVNTSAPLEEQPDSAIASLFGRDDQAEDIPWARGRNRVLEAKTDWVAEVDEYDATIQGLRDAIKDGGPAVFTKQYRVVDNRWHGVKGGRTVTIAWFYNHPSQAWKDALSAEGRRLLGTKPFSAFPHFRTFVPRRRHLDHDTHHSLFKAIEPVDLVMDQVQLLANLSAWSVLEARRRGRLNAIFD